MSQGALAEELGPVREIVVRTLREFREAGIVAGAGPGRTRVLNAEERPRIAAEGPG
jgi:hypothetical protein